MNEQHEPINDEAEQITREYLKSALEHMLAAGRSVRDMVQFSLERFGDEAIPQLKSFLDQVQSGDIKIKGLSKSTREALFGLQMSPQEREDLVRLAAYVRAESRGFVGGSPEDDWQEAEREVEAMLAERIGLVAQGRRAISEAGAAIGREIGGLKAAVSLWVEGGAPAQTPAPAPAAEPASAPAAEPAPAQPAAQAPSKKKVAKKTAAQKDPGGAGAEASDKPAATAAKPSETQAAKKVAKSAAEAGGKKSPKKPSKK